MISEEYLNSYGAEKKIYKSGDVIFHEYENPIYYFQIGKGSVKLNNYNENGKEFIQNILYAGKSIAETLLFINENYPVNAVATEDSEIFRLKKESFLMLIKDKPELYKIFFENVCEQVNYQYIMLQAMSLHNPENQLMALMNYLKNHHIEKTPFSLQIPFTRQQLASLTGLSVETVIRVIKKMESKKILKIQNRKIFY